MKNRIKRTLEFDGASLQLALKYAVLWGTTSEAPETQFGDDLGTMNCRKSLSSTRGGQFAKFLNWILMPPIQRKLYWITDHWFLYPFTFFNHIIIWCHKSSREDRMKLNAVLSSLRFNHFLTLMTHCWTHIPSCNGGYRMGGSLLIDNHMFFVFHDLQPCF